MKKLVYIMVGVFVAGGMSVVAQELSEKMTTTVVDDLSLSETSEKQESLSATDQKEVETIDLRATHIMNEKRRQIVDLVKRGKKAFQERSFSDVVYAINHTNEFRVGELYLYLFDMSTTLVAHGEDYRQTWDDLYNLQDEFGNYAMRQAVEVAKQGGGWYVYRWHNTTKTAYVQMVEKDGKKYSLGCGYYPLSKKEYAIGLVKGAISTFKRLRKKGKSRPVVFGSFSYPFGKFVHGDLALRVITEKGVAAVYGDQYGFVGESLWDFKSNDRYIYRDIISRLKEEPLGEGVWFDYYENGAVKKVYAERLVDEGRNYIIMSGYYPDADQSKVISLVKKGAAYLESHGPDAAAREFTQPALQEKDKRQPFRFGSLYLVVYNFDGVCIAHGDNRQRVGSNELESFKDADGRFIVKELLAKAQRSKSGWLDFRRRNAFWSIYFEAVTVGDKRFLVCSGMYPITKDGMMQVMVRTATEYFSAHPNHECFTEFSNAQGSFVRGDLEIFVLDTTGLCLVWGLDHVRIWDNLIAYKDQKDRPIIKMMINSTNQGAITITARERGARKTYYVDRVVKKGKAYIIGSGFYP